MSPRPGTGCPDRLAISSRPSRRQTVPLEASATTVRAAIGSAADTGAEVLVAETGDGGASGSSRTAVR